MSSRIVATNRLTVRPFRYTAKSLEVQLSDWCAYACRRLEEENADIPVREINRGTIDAVKPLQHRGEESPPDVLAWLEAEQKRSGQGPKPRGR
jgi:hypothetical protein